MNKGKQEKWHFRASGCFLDSALLSSSRPLYSEMCFLLLSLSSACFGSKEENKGQGGGGGLQKQSLQ